MKKARKYTNKLLTTPFDKERWFGHVTIAHGDGYEEERKAAYGALLLEKINALYQHYGIYPSVDDAATKLILSLAADHVPGFQVRSSKDKREKWDESRLVQLHATVEILLPRLGSERAALKHIANNPAYKDLTGGAQFERLKELHRKSKKPENNFRVQMMEHLREQGLPDENLEGFGQFLLERTCHPACKK